MKEKKLQWVKCDSCGELIERIQGEERTCATCDMQRADGAAIDDQYYD